MQSAHGYAHTHTRPVYRDARQKRECALVGAAETCWRNWCARKSALVRTMPFISPFPPLPFLPSWFWSHNSWCFVFVIVLSLIRFLWLCVFFIIFLSQPVAFHFVIVLFCLWYVQCHGHDTVCSRDISGALFCGWDRPLFCVFFPPLNFNYFDSAPPIKAMFMWSCKGLAVLNNRLLEAYLQEHILSDKWIEKMF